MVKIPILIDTDPGVDDFFCLAMGGANPEVFDLRAVTTIGGNHYTEVTTQNALDILDLLHVNAPVAAGATSYLKEEFGEPATPFHGENGLGNMVIPHTATKASDLPAWEMIYETAKQYPGELVIVTVGPETNLAHAILKHPDIIPMIRKIVVMGGSTTRGNITPYAEANIGHDCYAAEVVFKSGIPIDMVGLNVTLTCPVSVPEFDEMAKNTRKDVADTMRGLIAFRRGEPMHDCIAISTLLDDQIMQWQDCHIRIETEDQVHLGQSVIEEKQEGVAHRAAILADLDRYKAAFAKMVAFYA